MDKSTACNVITAAGAVYAAQTLLVPHTYLEQDGTAVNADTEALTRGLGGGILGLTSVAYMAAKSDSDEAKTIALCSGATAFAAWSANNAYRATTKGSLQSKVDTACALGLFAVACAALMGGKK